MKDLEYRQYFEELLDEINQIGYKMTEDQDHDGSRQITFEKYQIVTTLIQTTTKIDFDIYADLRKGTYEIGDIHLLSRKMFELKKICLKYNCREMNTTERLYPKDRQGSETKTSGL